MAAALALALWASSGRARRKAWLLAFSGAVALIALGVSAGGGATALLSGEPPLARVSLGPAAWAILASAYILLFSGRRAFLDGDPEGSSTSETDRLRRARRWSWTALAYSGWLALALMGLAGGFKDLAIARELSAQGDSFWREALRHVALSAGGLGVGTALAVPLGIAAARRRRLGDALLGGASILQTVPSLALFGFLVAPLAALSAAFPILGRLGIRGIGVAPVVIALVVYALLPVVRNTYTALIEVDEGVRDAGRGMGMSTLQLLLKVELPLAVPLILEGVRTAAVQLVGIAALGAFIGAGGLGVFIVLGIGQTADDLILVGALPTILLAMLVDRSLAALTAALTPRGLTS